MLDWRGQVVTMTDRAYLAANMPTCVVWGARDTVIPVSHAENARRSIPGARIEIVAGAGHFPHEEFPDQFAEILSDFVRSTSPSVYNQKRWRQLLRHSGTETSSGSISRSATGAEVVSAAPA